jgi:hypothetical protein
MKDVRIQGSAVGSHAAGWHEGPGGPPGSAAPGQGGLAGKRLEGAGDGQG